MPIREVNPAEIQLDQPEQGGIREVDPASVQLDDPDELEFRGELLPFGKTQSGDVVFALPQFIEGPRQTIMEILEGKRGIGEISGKEAFELGGLFAGPSVASGLASRAKAPAAKAATKAVAKVTRPIKTAADVARGPLRSPEKVADDIVAKTITQRSGKELGDITKELDAGQAATQFGGNSKGVLPESIAELGGEATQSLLEATIIAPGRARGIVKEAVNKRQTGTRDPFSTEALPKTVGAQQAELGQSGRLLDDLARAFEIKSEGSAFKTERVLKAELSKQARPAYRKAFAKGEEFNIAPAIQNAMAEMADLEGGPLTALRTSVRLFLDKSAKKNFRPYGRKDEVKRFDSAMRALNDKIDVAKRAGRNEAVLVMTRFKNELLDGVFGGDRLNPTINKGLHEARNLWSGGKSMQNAIDLGRKAIREGAEVTREQIADLTPGEMKMFRLGLFEAIKKTRRKRTDDFTQIFRREGVAELLREVMPKRKSGSAKTKPSDQFGELLAREGRIVQTRNMLGNSRTAFRLESQEDFDRMAAFMSRVRSNGFISAVIDTAALELQRFFGMREAVATRVAEMLTSTNPDEIKSIISRLEGSFGKERAQQANGIVLDIVAQIEQAATLTAGRQSLSGIRPIAAEDASEQQ